MKPGYQTTEFWITIITQILGVLATTGMLTPDQSNTLSQAAIQLGGVVAMAGSAFGYSLSRGKAKSGTTGSQAGFVGTRLLAVISSKSIP